MRWIFWKKRKLKLEDKVNEYMIKLHHSNGITTIDYKVSEKTLGFLRENLGRDQVYVQDHITVNLREFSVLEVSEKSKIK